MVHLGAVRAELRGLQVAGSHARLEAARCLLSRTVMSTHTFDFGSQLERMMSNRRVRIGGLIGGALVIMSSLIVVNVSNAPSRSRATKSVAVLPDSPLNIPIMRQWPYPQASAAATATVTVRAPGAKAVKRGVLTARR